LKAKELFLPLIDRRGKLSSPQQNKKKKLGFRTYLENQMPPTFASFEAKEPEADQDISHLSQARESGVA